MDTRIRIRPFAPEDMELTAAFAEAGGWGDRRPYLRFYLAHPRCRLLVVELDGVVVATGNATVNGATGWLGELFVSADHRRSGVGSALFEARMRYLQGRGCQTLLAVATAMGRPIEERFGFEPVAPMYRFRGPAAAEKPSESGLRPLAPSDLDAVVEIDRTATGEDRAHLITAFSAGGWVATDRRGRVRGYFLPTPWSDGAVIATEPGPAKLLLEMRRALGRDVVSLPADNQAALAHLETLGYTRVEELTRMTKGSPVHWDPTKIWSCFNLALG